MAMRCVGRMGEGGEKERAKLGFARGKALLFSPVDKPRPVRARESHILRVAMCGVQEECEAKAKGNGTAHRYDSPFSMFSVFCELRVTRMRWFWASPSTSPFLTADILIRLSASRAN